jgi:hypothetical protein
MGLTDCIDRAASPPGLLIFPRMGFTESYALLRIAGECDVGDGRSKSGLLAKLK